MHDELQEQQWKFATLTVAALWWSPLNFALAREAFCSHWVAIAVYLALNCESHSTWVFCSHPAVILLWSAWIWRLSFDRNPSVIAAQMRSLVYYMYVLAAYRLICTCNTAYVSANPVIASTSLVWSRVCSLLGCLYSWVPGHGCLLCIREVLVRTEMGAYIFIGCLFS